jgi:tetratricopeptide (TPR) repeat protein
MGQAFSSRESRALTLSLAAGSALDSGMLHDALALSERALELRAQGSDRELISRSMSITGTILDELGRKAEALHLHERSLAMLLAVLGEDSEDPELATSMHNTAHSIIEIDIERIQEAFDLSNKALKIRNAANKAKRTEESQLALASSANLTASIIKRGGHFEKALELHRIAFDIYDGKNHPDTAVSANNVGQVLWLLNRKSEAAEYAELAFRIGEKVYAEGDRRLAVIRQNLAIVRGDGLRVEEEEAADKKTV